MGPVKAQALLKAARFLWFSKIYGPLQSLLKTSYLWYPPNPFCSIPSSTHQNRKTIPLLYISAFARPSFPAPNFPHFHICAPITFDISTFAAPKFPQFQKHMLANVEMCKIRGCECGNVVMELKNCGNMTFCKLHIHYREHMYL